MTDLFELTEESKKLRNEAKNILNQLFNSDPSIGDNSIDRFVDCIISSAILEVTGIIKKVILEKN